MSDQVRLRRNAPLGSAFPVVGGASYLPLWGQGVGANGGAPRAAQLVAQTEIFQRLDATVSVTGVTAIGALGTVTPVVTNVVTVFAVGIASVAAVGDEVVQIPINNPTATGVAATGAVGTAVVNVGVNVTGVSATSGLGSVTVTLIQRSHIDGIQFLRQTGGSGQPGIALNRVIDSTNADYIILVVNTLAGNSPDYPPPFGINAAAGAWAGSGSAISSRASDGGPYFTDSLHNNWICLGGAKTIGVSGASDESISVWVCWPTQRATNEQITFTQSAYQTCNVTCWKNTGGLDNGINWPYTTPVLTVGGNITNTPSAPNEAIYTAVSSEGNGWVGAPAGYTLLINNSAFNNIPSIGAAYKIKNDAADESPIWTLSPVLAQHQCYHAQFLAPLFVGSGSTSGGTLQVDAYGLSATGQVGTVTITATRSVNVTGVAATAAVGSLAFKVDVSTKMVGMSLSLGTVAVFIIPDLTIAVTGVEASGLATTPTPQVTKAVTGVNTAGAIGSVGAGPGDTLDGVQATGSLGSVTAGPTPYVTGLAAQSAVGVASVQIDNARAVSVQGVSATGFINASPAINFHTTGVEGDFSVGTVAAGPGDSDNSVAATGAVGSVGWVVGLDFPGCEAVGAVGSPSIQAGSDRFVNVDGVEADGGVGNAIPEFDRDVFVTGVVGNGVVGSVVPGVAPDATGVQATGVAGPVQGGVAASVSGVEAAGAVGAVSITVEIRLTGVAAQVQLGTISLFITGNFFVPVQGVEAIGRAGYVWIYAEHALTGVGATGAVGRGVPEVDVFPLGVEAVGEVGNVGILITLDLGYCDEDYLWALREVENLFTQAEDAALTFTEEVSDTQISGESTEFYVKSEVEALYVLRDVDDEIYASEPDELTFNCT
jgi:hypothetical protein